MKIFYVLWFLQKIDITRYIFNLHQNINKTNQFYNIPKIYSRLYNFRRIIKKMESLQLLPNRIEISDSFVHPDFKLSNGKNGNGERRLYTGDNNTTNIYLSSKPWKLLYDPDYITDFNGVLENPIHFRKPLENRKQLFESHVTHCHEKLLRVQPQNGESDVCRFYIGPLPHPKKEEKTIEEVENIKLYDNFRKTLVAKQVHLEFEDSDEYIICKIINNSNVAKCKTKKFSSKTSIDYLNYISGLYCIEIQHEDNGGEFQLRNPTNGYYWPVDGIHKCGEHKCSGSLDSPCKYNNHIWEFQGDYFHGNPNKYDINNAKFHNITYTTKHQKDRDKREFYEKNGYIVNIVWESEWTEIKKELKKQGKTWN